MVTANELLKKYPSLLKEKVVKEANGATEIGEDGKPVDQMADRAKKSEEVKNKIEAGYMYKVNKVGLNLVKLWGSFKSDADKWVKDNSNMNEGLTDLGIAATWVAQMGTDKFTKEDLLALQGNEESFKVISKYVDKIN